VAAAGIAEELRERGLRVGVDERPETLGKRIRAAELEKVPFVVVYGERESRDALAVRRHHGEQSTQSLDELAGEIARAATI
jgi:threonyl-tRNA synthetase